MIAEERCIRVVIVIDIGSSSVRASAFEVSEVSARITEIPGSLFRNSDAPLRNGTVDPNAVLIATNEVLWRTLTHLRAHGVKTVDSIGFSSLVMNLFGVFPDGKPATPVFTYASALQLGEELACGIEERRLHHKLTGTFLGHPSYAQCHMRQYNSSDPRSDESLFVWQTLSSFIISKWITPPAGDWSPVPISYSEASWAGLLHTEDLTWQCETLNRLPLLKDFDEFACSFDAHITAQWPELTSTKIFLGVGDGAAANIGTEYLMRRAGVLIDGCITVGTSAAVRVTTRPSGATSVWGLWRYRVSRGLLVIGGALSDGGSLLEWFGNCFGAAALHECDLKLHQIVFADPIKDNSAVEELDKVRPGIGILPFWSGERATGWNQAASGHISGITRETTSFDIYYALVESLAFRLLEIVNKLKDSGALEATAGEMRPVLGASGAVLEKNRAVCQIIADITGCIVVVLGGTTNTNDGSSASPAAGGVGELTSCGIACLINNINIKEDGPKRAGEIAAHEFDNVVSIERFEPREYMKEHNEKRFRSHRALYDKILTSS
jgi:gluconokinase